MTRLIFLPGMDGSVHIFSQLKRLLSAHPVTIVCYPKQITDEWLSDIIASTDAHILIGFSFGGILARRLATLRPEFVTGVICVNSAYALSQLNHRLHPMLPWLNRLPKWMIQSLYRKRLRGLLSNEGFDYPQSVAYLAKISDAHDIIARHQLIKHIWVDTVQVPVFWIFGTLSAELSFQKEIFCTFRPNEAYYIVQGGHRCLLTKPQIVEQNIKQVIQKLEIS